MDDSADSVRMARLRWRCRRGLLELDLLFARFLQERYPRLAPAEQKSFETLLELPDSFLLACLQGRESPPQELEEIVRKIRQ
jgi:antitoxin CptB